MKRLESVLRQFPHGIRIVELAEKLGISRSYAYDLLNSLELQGKAHYERGIAYPGKSQKGSKKLSNEKKISKHLSKEEREYLERRAKFYENVEWIASQWDVFEPLKEYADISRKVRKELGLE